MFLPIYFGHKIYIQTDGQKIIIPNLLIVRPFRFDSTFVLRLE